MEEQSDPLAALAGVVEMLLERVSRIEEDFYKKVLGGIDGLYATNMRHEGMKSFGEKYGGTLSPYADDFKRVYQSDLMEKAYDFLEAMKGEEGYTDEKGDEQMNSVIIGGLKERGLGPKEAPVAAVVEEKPAEGKAEEEPDEMQAMYDEIDMMKRRDAARKKGA